MEHTKHLWRAALLIVAVLVTAVLVRHFLVPDTFGELGFYRADSVGEFMELPVRHGAARACAACHAPEQEQHDEGAHATVACEGCHLPLASHVRPNAGGEPEKFAEMPTNRTQELCEQCHLRLRARPKDFPQIEPGPHLIAVEAIEEGEPVLRDTCFVCHSPHSPKID